MKDVISPRRYHTVYKALSKLKTGESVVFFHQVKKDKRYTKTWKRKDGTFRISLSKNNKRYSLFYKHTDEETVALFATQMV